MDISENLREKILDEKINKLSKEQIKNVIKKYREGWDLYRIHLISGISPELIEALIIRFASLEDKQVRKRLRKAFNVSTPLPEDGVPEPEKDPEKARKKLLKNISEIEEGR